MCLSDGVELHDRKLQLAHYNRNITIRLHAQVKNVYKEQHFTTCCVHCDALSQYFPNLFVGTFTHPHGMLDVFIIAMPLRLIYIPKVTFYLNVSCPVLVAVAKYSHVNFSLVLDTVVDGVTENAVTSTSVLCPRRMDSVTPL